MPRRYDEKMFDIAHLRATADKCKNWGKWGPDDQAGTLNYVTPEAIEQSLVGMNGIPRDGRRAIIPAAHPTTILAGTITGDVIV